MKILGQGRGAAVHRPAHSAAPEETAVVLVTRDSRLAEVVGSVAASGGVGVEVLGGREAVSRAWSRNGPLLVGADMAGSVICLLYTSPSPRDLSTSRMPSSA